MGFFSKISDGLKKTREGLSRQMDLIVNSFTAIDDDLIDELEESLILADVGSPTAAAITARLREEIKRTGVTDPARLKEMLAAIVAEMVTSDCELALNTAPSVILVIGVNGAGKTTTIGKLAMRLKGQGKSVMLCAADTFRAAAIQQLDVWAERAGVEIIKQAEGSDPAAVVFDGMQAGKARNKDVVIVDTAGRLQNKKHLMEELSKIRRVISRELPDADVETLLVLDATTGQNALSQAKLFGEAAGITGLVLTKLDGTAKGGVVISLARELDMPVKFIGVGEGIEDLRPFDPEQFSAALFAPVEVREEEA
ncbi:MAG: signal recognition particle-docking protein FtsY [Oscillospiraceae bacterium]|nr:signal recognition particle-docking protein FtsY [Oscillospiraceae bacterium]